MLSALTSVCFNSQDWLHVYYGRNLLRRRAPCQNQRGDAAIWQDDVGVLISILAVV